MNNENIRVGLDCRNDLVYAARVDYSGDRPEIKALVRLPRSQPLEHHLLDSATLRLAVADNKATVKKIFQPEAGNLQLDDLVKFELVQSLMEDENLFNFSFSISAHKGKLFATAIRKSTLASFEPKLANGQIIDSYQVRAISAAHAYASFCRHESGELICLADLNENLISLAITYRGELAGLGSISIVDFDLNDPAGLKRVAIELKTLLNFQLAALFDEGITVPPAGLLLSGEEWPENSETALSELFSFNISKPELNLGFFSDPNSIKGLPIENYLVALGLTIS